MDDAEQIDRLIEVMNELKSLARDLDDPNNDQDMTISLIVALIITTQVPDVKILSSQYGVAYA
jgi:hypothetical protein|tara:strand:- start:92 stop:280 length:189 start_codon:yes stop_codon:yes gene_type:complete